MIKKKTIQVEATFADTNINNKRNINFLQNTPHGIQYVYYKLFTISSNHFQKYSFAALRSCTVVFF